ncbi:ATP-binding protein [Ruminobacter sp. RM87]|jgi:two-component system aerobic respiration control sensor histidine kinase ArcB|uniref:ATP-binding protein n=1 Tax=Ruminobacter sp. RM87 TaxID=1200567 RepID=UPI0004E25258|nr:ATP-binding protein [Ruminobacter sp. RM87]
MNIYSVCEQKLKHWVSRLYQKSVVYLSAVLGFFLTLFITVVHCALSYFFNGAISIYDVIQPLCYGALLTPFVVFFFYQVFADVENARTQVKDMKKSLAKTYVAMINQRDRNLTLTKDHEVLRGQKKKVEKELEEQATFFSAIVDLTPDIIMYRDEFGNIKGCNDNMLRLLGIKDAAQLVELLKDDHELDDIFAKFDDILKMNKSDVTYESTINGVVYQMRKRPAVNAEGNLIGIMLYGHDITKLKYEQDLLEKTSRDKSNFISTLSHELRTPLNGIVGLSDILMQTGRFNGDDMRNLKAINVSAVTLGNIFNDVIDLNKFERQTFNVIYEKVKWQDFLDDFETLSHLMTEQKNLDFKFNVEGKVAEYLLLDPTRLRQILWNLTGNAIKFTKKGGITINVKQHMNGDAAELSFAITDTGIGIAKEEQEKIFGLYYQVEGTKQSTGTGIGLHVTKNLCQALNGSVHLDSELGKGSTFTVKFSFKQTDGVSESRQVKTSLRVLLVEDVDLNILVARTMLEKLGHKVFVAKTGQEAIDLFKSEELDLALLDMQLPDMTGFDVADVFVNELGCRIPLIALTANVINDRQEYEKHHIDGVMNKPLSLSKLVENLQKYQE